MLIDIGNLTVIIRGAGDVASGIGYRLYKSGFKVIFLEKENPQVVRRKVSFAEAVYNGECMVEGIKGKHTTRVQSALDLLEEGILPVLVDPKGELIKEIIPNVLVDATIAKKNIGTNRSMADLVIGVGPGFVAGSDVDVIVESNRGHNLGRVLYEGKAEENTGIPGMINGYSKERVLRSNHDGHINVLKDIGSIVNSGDVLATIDGHKVNSKIDGVVRGMIRNGFKVKKGMKIGDVDPRGDINNCYTISDKALAIGGGVLEAILSYLNRRLKDGFV